MNFLVVSSKKLRKLVKKFQRSGKENLVESLAEVVDLFAVRDSRALFVLHDRWRDHALKGSKAGIRELHLSQDDLLLYVIHEDTRTVELFDIVTHEDLRRQK